MKKFFHVLESCEIGTKAEEEFSGSIHLLANINILCQIGLAGKDTANISLLIASKSE